MQQLPDLGAIHLVPRHGVDNAIGDVKFVQQVLAAENALLRGAGKAGRVKALAVLLHLLQCAERHIGIVLLTGIVQRLQKAGQNHVIGVDEGIVAAASGVDTGIAGNRQALIFLMNDPHTGITSGVFVADFSAAIGGAIVNEQHLDGHVDFLVKNTLYTFDQIGLRVIDWYDHADRNMFHNLFSLPLYADYADGPDRRL